MLTLGVVASSWAQVDTIRIDRGDLVTSKLKPGLHQYLVYYENPVKKLLGVPAVWNRQVNFKTWKGREVIEIEQHWFMADTAFNRYVYSLCDRKTFNPIYHYTKSTRGVDAFDFSKSSVSGSDSVTSNTKKDLDVSLSDPTLNWEVDLEVFNTLPIKKTGQRFVINFYHPGGKSLPTYYEYVVTGEEKIKTIEERWIDCWLLKISYSEQNWAMFWIDKRSQEVLKVRDFYNGVYRCKVRTVMGVPMLEKGKNNG